MITQEYLRTIFHYDPITGIFTWKTNMGNVKCAGKRAGWIHPKYGYVVIRVCGINTGAHRLAWIFSHGINPKEIIDHRDGNPSNNALENLRLASPSLNGANSKCRSNSKSGIKGVRKVGKRWEAKANRKYIGTYDTIAEASAAYLSVAKSLWGEFARSH